MSYNVVFLTGPPGSGKTVLASKLAKDYGIYHLCLDKFLAELARDETSPAGQAIKSHLEKGIPIPTEGIIIMLQEKMKMERKNGHRDFLIDGFPSDFTRAFAFEKKLRMPSLVISLQCPKETARDRVLSRTIDDQSLNDKETFETRFDLFTLKQPDVLYYYRAASTLLEVVSSTDTKVTYGVLTAALQMNGNWKLTRRPESPDMQTSIDQDGSDVILLSP
ncbi:hypothetical protein AJ79_05402 [Helicocarpus griseus UAMH5409]|uniref:Uncharacterized protein n=1 Tax=Helicocarpus griseus UAMH5409 TaxID=1447875 RepID=A0A2B7XNS6_9EURO|nr:hypothetical protein AJ79_05402 [Helicocarpus griseus UAMH5409]